MAQVIATPKRYRRERQFAMLVLTIGVLFVVVVGILSVKGF
jgi:predicted nucleic acid-binding Zn ribbon protein